MSRIAGTGHETTESRGTDAATEDPQRPVGSHARSGVRASAWAAVGIGALFCLWLGLEGAPRSAPSGDLSEYFNNAYRTWHGDTPYEDFWLLFPPGEVYLPALVLALASGQLNALAWVGCAVAAAVGAVAFHLGWLLGRHPGWGLLAALCAFFAGSVAYKSGGYAYGHYYLLFPLLALVALYRFVDRRRPSAVLLAGLALGAGLCFRLFMVGAAGAAIAIVVAMAVRRDRVPWAGVSRQLGLLALGPVAIATTVAVAMGPTTPTMTGALLFDAVDHGRTYRGEELRLIARPRFVLEGIAASTRGEGSARRRWRFVDEAVHLALLATAWPAWLTVRRRRLDRPATAVADACLVWSTLLLVRVAGRADPGHLTSATTPLFLVAVWIASSPGRRAADRFARGLMLVLLLAACRPAVARAWTLPRRLVASPPTLSAPAGRLAFSDRRQADLLARVLAAIDAHSSPGDAVFVTSWRLPPIYAWTDRRNPTRYDSMIDLVFRPEVDDSVVCEALEATPPRLVVHEPGLSIGNLALEESAPALVACLEERFRAIERVGPLEIRVPSAE